MALIANIGIPVEAVAGVVTKVFATIGSNPPVEVAITDGVAKLQSAVGSAIHYEIQRINSLGFVVAMQAALNIDPPPVAHPPVTPTVEYVDDGLSGQ